MTNCEWRRAKISFTSKLIILHSQFAVKYKAPIHKGREELPAVPPFLAATATLSGINSYIAIDFPDNVGNTAQTI